MRRCPGESCASVCRDQPSYGEPNMHAKLPSDRHPADTQSLRVNHTPHRESQPCSGTTRIAPSGATLGAEVAHQFLLLRVNRDHTAIEELRRRSGWPRLSCSAGAMQQSTADQICPMPSISGQLSGQRSADSRVPRGSRLAELSSALLSLRGLTTRMRPGSARYCQVECSLRPHAVGDSEMPAAAHRDVPKPPRRPHPARSHRREAVLRGASQRGKTSQLLWSRASGAAGVSGNRTQVTTGAAMRRCPGGVRSPAKHARNSRHRAEHRDGDHPHRHARGHRHRGRRLS